MRILLATDLHGSAHAADLIKQKVEELAPDLFVACGDITHFGESSFDVSFLREIPVKTFAVPGNCDPPELAEKLDEMGVNIHGKKVEFGGQKFVGLGGSNPTPFDTLFEIPEEEILRILDPLMESGAILVSHAPPFGFCDLTWQGEHVGSRALLDIVNRFQPRVVLTGHIHESPGIVEGAVTVVNPGPASRGKLGLVEIDGSVTAKLLSEIAR